ASKEATDLTADTLYYVWVRSVCEEVVGAWTGPVTFRSACYPICEFTENFDAATVPALPAYWSMYIRVGVPGQYASIQTATFNNLSAPNSVALTPGSFVTLDADNDFILVSPNLSTLETGTHRLKFSVKGTGNIQVGTLDNNTN